MNNPPKLIRTTCRAIGHTFSVIRDRRVRVFTVGRLMVIWESENAEEESENAEEADARRSGS